MFQVPSLSRTERRTHPSAATPKSCAQVSGRAPDVHTSKAETFRTETAPAEPLQRRELQARSWATRSRCPMRLGSGLRSVLRG